MKVNQGLLGGKETRGILPGLFQGNGYLILPGLFQGNGYLHPKVWEEDDGKDKPAGEKEKEAFLGVDPGGARLPGQVLSGISRRFFFFFFFFWPCHTSCRILVSRPGNKPRTPCTGSPES